MHLICTPNPLCVPAHWRHRNTAKLQYGVIRAPSISDWWWNIAYLREAHWGFGFPQSIHVLFFKSSLLMSSCSSFFARVWSIGTRVNKIVESNTRWERVSQFTKSVPPRRSRLMTFVWRRYRLRQSGVWILYVTNIFSFLYPQHRDHYNCQRS